MSNQNNKIVVGMGATEILYSDRHAGTIVNVFKNKKGKVIAFDWQEDIATRRGPVKMTESQQYTYAPNVKGRKCHVTLRKNGSWVVKGQAMRNGTRFAIGNRTEYHDYSF